MNTFIVREKEIGMKKKDFSEHKVIKLETITERFWENLKYLQIKLKASK